MRFSPILAKTWGMTMEGFSGSKWSFRSFLGAAQTLSARIGRSGVFIARLTSSMPIWGLIMGRASSPRPGLLHGMRWGSSSSSSSRTGDVGVYLGDGGE